MTKIILSADKKSWSLPIQHGSQWDKNKRMQKIRDKILRRDHYICQGCTWKSDKYQEIHHKDGNHSNFNENNLETLCPLCHQVFHPNLASISSSGVMIWLPELTQEQLNLFLIPMFCILREKEHPLFTIAKSISGIIEKRKVFMENQIGKIDPAIWGQVLLNMKKDEYEKREEFFKSIKMLALPQKFEVEIEYWSKLLKINDKKSIKSWKEKAGKLKLMPSEI